VVILDVIVGSAKRITYVLFGQSGIAKAFWSAARVFVPGGGADLEPACEFYQPHTC
jgi:hypothetical protein